MFFYRCVLLKEKGYYSIEESKVDVKDQKESLQKFIDIKSTLEQKLKGLEDVSVVIKNKDIFKMLEVDEKDNDKEDK